MTGFLLLAGLIAVTIAGLWWAGRLRGAALQIGLAALLLGAAGYALQGRPGLAGVSREGQAGPPVLVLTEPRQAMLGTFTAGERFLLISDSYARRGKRQEAFGAVQAGLRRYPDDLSLRIGLANALVDLGGTVTPAARLAFEQARLLRPDHPAPHFFEGLALARAGQRDEAATFFRRALALTPREASFRPMVVEAVRVLDRPAQPASAPRQ